MIEAIIIILYSLLVMKIKFTPVISTLTFINRHILSRIFKAIGKLFPEKKKGDLVSIALLILLLWWFSRFLALQLLL